MRRLERGTSANCCTTGNYSLGSRG
jgi:hypothetical protein